MLALAQAARRRGHDVTFIAPDNAVAWIRASGFACEGNGVDVEALLRRAGTDLQSLRWQTAHMRDLLVPRQFASLAHAPDADVIVGSGVQVAAASVAEQRRIPYVTVMFCPCAIPSGDWPPPFFRSQTMPRWINALIWRWGRPVAALAMRGPIDRGRATLGLPPAADVLRLLAGTATMIAADRELGPAPVAVPPNVVVTDAWVFEDPASLARGVEAFLDGGEPPVYVGFGSMPAGRAQQLAARIAAAARTVGCRLIVAGGWAKLDASLETSARVLAIDAAPHRLLLPRVAAAVHHGGAGTTTAAARAGVPQVIAPHILDQFYWAHRVEQLGLGPRAVAVDRITAELLADHIRAAIEQPRFKRAAQALAPRVASRNGVEDAVAHIESIQTRPLH